MHSLSDRSASADTAQCGAVDYNSYPNCCFLLRFRERKRDEEKEIKSKNFNVLKFDSKTQIFPKHF